MARRRGERKVPNFPPTPVKLATMANFTGGLNLRGNAFQLADNETPDCLDVDLQIGGGFLQRKVVIPWGTNPPSQVMQNIWSYAQVGGSNQVVGQGADGKIYFSSGVSWAATGGGGATVRTGLCTAAEFNGDLYITDGTVGPLRWDGTTATTLAQAFNETIGTEGAHDGNMPIAKLVAAHMGRLFIANTTESAVAFPNRIRWSHAGFAEDWRQEDFIDIDVGRDGDFITAIIQFRERLYIFKRNSCYELVGYGPATFQVVPLSQDIGCVGPLAAVVSDVGLFTFSWPQGVYLDKGSGPYPIFDKIWPLIRDGFIQETFASKIALGWINRNLWCAVPYNGSGSNNRVYVYDPWIWKHRYMRFLEGPWYPYNLPVSAFCTQVTTAGLQYLGAHATVARIGQLEQVGGNDNWGGGTTNSLTAYYRTDWFDLGQEAMIKRWRHPEFVLRQGTAESIQVDVYRNYNPDSLYSTYFISPPAVNTGGLLWDIGAVTPGTITQGGTPGATSYGYLITAVKGGLEGEASVEVTTTTGNAALSGTNFNTIPWTALSQADSYNVYGRTIGGENLLLGNTTALTFNDTGMAGTAQTPPATSNIGGKWDDGTGTLGGKWNDPVQQGEAIVRGLTMGRARAIQMVFTGPSNVAWGLDAMTLKVIPVRVHG